MKVVIIGVYPSEIEKALGLIKILENLKHEIILMDSSPPNDIGSQLLKVRDLINDPICIVDSQSKYHK